MLVKSTSDPALIQDSQHAGMPDIPLCTQFNKLCRQTDLRCLFDNNVFDELFQPSKLTFSKHNIDTVGPQLPVTHLASGTYGSRRCYHGGTF